MRRLLASAASVIVVVWSTGVLADDKSDCLEGIGHDLRIKSCSAVLDRNPNDAAAYYARGVAHQFKGDIDRAISDYNKAIELNPYHASAYDGRGRAYASKGDYTNAVVDVTTATELAPKSAPEPKKITAAHDLTKASQLAPASPPPPKIAPAPQVTPAPEKMKAPARTSGMVAKTGADVPKPAAKQVIEKPWPAWAPQGKTD
jgi:tetratricopeptide (TPR) repeat protein